MNKPQRVAQCAGVLLALLFPIIAAAAASAWKPDKPVEFIVATAAGSGVDATARSIQKILQSEKLVTVPITVANKAGGANVAMAYLAQHDRDGHKLLIQTSTGLATYAAGTADELLRVHADRKFDQRAGHRAGAH